MIVGERTWGKGSVQNVIQLEGGSSALKLTTASYHRPSGRNIHRFPNSKENDVWGVMPDKGLEVKMARLDMIRYQEYRRKRDVIQDGGPPKSDFVDSQLAKAVAHLTAGLAYCTTWPAALVRLQEAVVLRDTITGEERDLPVTGVFIAIGHHPNTGLCSEGPCAGASLHSLNIEVANGEIHLVD